MMFPSTTTRRLAARGWDSDHFGFPVAQIDSPELQVPELENVLHAAELQGVRLVYWPAQPGVQVPPPLLRQYGGALVDRKVTYGKELAAEQEQRDAPAAAARVREYPPGPATPRLVELAVQAGGHSRFRVDARIPQERCEALYALWMQRSALRELAGTVLVAGEEVAPAGMITVSVDDGCGSIGLIAVAPEARGQGIASELLLAAHRWMQDQGAGRATVVTQQTNLPACRLYERAGYRPVDVKHFYHFWLPERGRRAA